jgi:uncharacterized protein YggL (DUF469 family)
MRRRLRKKRREGEFASHAFGVSYVLDDISSTRVDTFLEQFVEQAIAPNKLQCLGSRRGRIWDFRVACVDHSQPTPAQRDAVVKWLKGRKELVEFEVGALSRL